MTLYVNGVLTPPADAGSLDGIPADLQPAGAGEDGHVVTYVHASGDLELKPASGGGMVNPMTAVGDIIAGSAPIVGGLATPARLAAGSAGYILRVVGGTPVWRELFDPGTSRPPAASTREGQWYWATNAAAGLELSLCTHQGGGTYAWVTVPYGVTATGVALVQATDAAAALAALFPSTSISLATAIGWNTTTAVGTTSVINTGAQRAELTVGASTATFTLASVARTTLPALGAWSARFRIELFDAVPATGTEQMLVRVTDSAGTTADLWIYGTDQASLTGAATPPVGSVTVAGLLAGQGWVEVTMEGAQITYSVGVGSSGSPPASWVTLAPITAAAIVRPYASLGVQIRRTVVQAVQLAANLGTFSYQDLDL